MPTQPEFEDGFYFYKDPFDGGWIVAEFKGGWFWFFGDNDIYAPSELPGEIGERIQMPQ